MSEEQNEETTTPTEAESLATMVELLTKILNLLNRRIR